MTLPDYLADIARALRERSSSIRRDFSTHHLIAGENREELVAQFLEEHLPKRFGVSTGLIISHDGLYSNQSDLLVVDHLNNAPLYGSARNKLWPLEAIFSLIEVKTKLTPTDLSDAIKKGRRFKSLKPKFADGPFSPRIAESLFVIWAFEAPKAETLKENLLGTLADVPRAEQPDFLVVPNGLVATSGSYLELAKLGQPGSYYRRELEAKHGLDLNHLIPEAAVVYDMGENSLMAWYIWFDSWLCQSGWRLTDPREYLPSDAIWGRQV